MFMSLVQLQITDAKLANKAKCFVDVAIMNCATYF